MALNAQQLGLDKTIAELRRILVDRFKLAKSPDAIDESEPLFSAGVGLSSLEGVELLFEVERQFDVKFNDVESWFDDPPTLAKFAERLIEQTKQVR